MLIFRYNLTDKSSSEGRKKLNPASSKKNSEIFSKIYHAIRMKTTHFYRRVHFSVIEIEQDWQHNKIVIPLKLPVSKGEQCDLGLRSQKKKSLRKMSS